MKTKKNKWGICPICDRRCLHGATFHYDCWQLTFGRDTSEARRAFKRGVKPKPVGREYGKPLP